MSGWLLIEGQLSQVIVLNTSIELALTAQDAADEMGMDYFLIPKDNRIVLDDPEFNRDWFVPKGKLPWMDDKLKHKEYGWY